MTTASHPAFEPGLSFTDFHRYLGGWLARRGDRARDPAASIMTLAREQAHAVRSFRGGLIECTEGCVWLTHDGDCRDVLLEAGQSHVADRNSRLVISAMTSAAVRLSPRDAVRG